MFSRGHLLFYYKTGAEAAMASAQRPQPCPHKIWRCATKHLQLESQSPSGPRGGALSYTSQYKPRKFVRSFSSRTLAQVAGPLTRGRTYSCSPRASTSVAVGVACGGRRPKERAWPEAQQSAPAACPQLPERLPSPSSQRCSRLTQADSGRPPPAAQPPALTHRSTAAWGPPRR